MHVNDLISDEYRKQNQQLHNERSDYGVGGRVWADQVTKLAFDVHALSILDYGAGKRTLEKEFLLSPFNFYSYDPCIPEIAKRTFPVDLVVCTDVLEHIEPDKLDNVIIHLDQLSNKALFIAINLLKGDKRLPDGRRNHLIVQSQEWWINKLPLTWHIQTIHKDESKIWFEVLK